MIFHLLRVKDWPPPQETYLPASLSLEGFIHCSFEQQVLASAYKHFTNDLELLVLVIDSRLLSSKLVVEAAADGGEEFPHIYGPLLHQEVKETRKLHRHETEESFRWVKKISPPQDDVS